MEKELRPIEQPSLGRAGKRKKALVWLRYILSQKIIRERVLAVTSFLAIVAILQINLVPKTLNVELGKPSPEDIRAPRTVINTVKTKELRDEAAAKAVEEAVDKPEYKTISTRAATEASAVVSEVFNIVDAKRQAIAELSPKEKEFLRHTQDLRGQLVKFKEEFAGLPPQIAEKLLTMGAEDYERIKKSVRQIFIALETEEKIDQQNVDKLKKELDRYILPYLVFPEDVEVVRPLISVMIFPNLVSDQMKLRQLQEEARKKVPPVIIERGKLVVREGEIITGEEIQVLRDLSLIDNQGNRVLVFISLAMFSLFLMGIGLLYIYHFKKALMKQERHLYLLALVTLAVLALAKGMTLLEVTWLHYLIPLSFASIILTILVDSQLSLVMTALLSLLTAVIVNFDLSLAIFYFISGAASIFSMLNITQRKELIKRGLILTGVNFLAVITLGLLFFGSRNFFNLMLFAITGGFNGILSTALANGFLPFLEHLFGMTSALSLLELSNPNLPLLKRLLIEAPGTYHHSILVGNLAEAAADAIGADSLLVRVGSYYHDIGKLRRPYFFIENQIAQDNPHEKLSPNLSTLIITSHVRDGVELAKSYGVPEGIIDIIEQHHGTDLVRYFFQRATENVQEDKERLKESDFRYPGPKPRSKEAALVMLADSVEAAARSMGRPSPARLEGMVTSILKDRLESGQLDEANLTFRDLDKIKSAFLKVLGGIFHHRIKYPEVTKDAERKR